MSFDPDRPFDNIINFRDVGRTINKVAGRKYAQISVVPEYKVYMLTWTGF
jgi:hypothetical protein